jgi:hypothetical protein
MLFNLQQKKPTINDDDEFLMYLDRINLINKKNYGYLIFKEKS